MYTEDWTTFASAKFCETYPVRFIPQCTESLGKKSTVLSYVIFIDLFGPAFVKKSKNKNPPK